MSILNDLYVVGECCRHDLMICCLWCLVAVLGGIALYCLGWCAAVYIRKVRRLGRIAQIGACILMSVAVIYGSNKPPTPSHLWRFEFVNGLRDNGSYCDEYGIHAAWRSDSVSITSIIKANYQDLSITNSLGQCVDTLHELPSCPASDLSHFWPVVGALNMRVVIWADYVQPPETHTNGVYRLPGVMRPMTDAQKYLTPTIRIEFADDAGEVEILTPTNQPPLNLLGAMADELL